MVTNSSNSKDLKYLQNQARAVIAENLRNSKIQAIDQEGIAQDFTMEDGQPRPANIIGFAGEAADIVAEKLGDLYQLFREKEFETLIKKGRDKDANKYFFGVILPRQYLGNNDPLTMTAEQVAEAENYLGKDDAQKSGSSWAQNIRAESVGEKTKEMPAFHAKENEGWLKEILDRGARDTTTNFADRLRRKAQATKEGRPI